MGRKARDPYIGWKILIIIMAAGTCVLSLLGIFLHTGAIMNFVALGLGVLMCAASGIMSLVKGRRVLGYLCSGLAGGFLVLLLVWIIRWV